jgi:hypothetical protein
VPYDVKDPRSQLATSSARSPGACAAAQYFELGQLAPDEISALGTETWLIRCQTGCLAFSHARAGDRLVREDQPDEYVALFPSPDAAAEVVWGTERVRVTGSTVVIVPPGPSEIVVEADGDVVRFFSCRTGDLLERCRNAEAYAIPDPNVTPFAPWPEPPEGWAIRAYPLAAIRPEPGRFGRILRSTTVMVNYLEPDDGPRDPAKLSPHHHDDFEQISLQLEGDYVHHIRSPWTVNLADWRDDDHRLCSSPAVAIIPPPAIHTSQSVGEMRHQLVDLFCPPRLDFSQRPGWVLNHDTYPMP